MRLRFRFRRPPTSPASHPEVCPSCGAALVVNDDLGYVCCSMLGPRHYWRWFTPQAMERAA